MKSTGNICGRLQGRLIVSCQAPEDSALRDPEVLARMAEATVSAGAAGIRADGPVHVAAIRRRVQVPIIGISKTTHDDGLILITPTFESARQLVEAGANLIALDCSARGQRYGALNRLRRIKDELGVPVLADVATLDEAAAAVQAGADLILTTLRGYTPETEHIDGFDLPFLRDLIAQSGAPVVAEGRIADPEQAAAAVASGAFAVIVGTAITRPDETTRRFVAAVERSLRAGESEYAIGIDLGSTNTKVAIVKRDGTLFSQASIPTPATAGKQALLGHLRSVATRCRQQAAEAGIRLAAVGIATGGWVDPAEGKVIHATGNLPGWMGAGIRAELEGAIGLPVGVENDANALAVGERHFGLGRDVDDFVCITLGTGVGGGCYVAGKLNRGSHYLGNAIGHINIEPGGRPCTCGQKGCLEAYANGAALVRYGGNGFETAEQVVQAAHNGHAGARQALRTYAGYLARGCAQVLHLLDPELLVISGGIAQNNETLLADLEEELSNQVIGWDHRAVRIAISPVACYGGVIGAAAVALDAARQGRCTGQ
ncbi:MAG: putative N-acetylmannosamine-6-phosphate 2-epimerase [Bryobacteraceae bacterium]